MKDIPVVSIVDDDRAVRAAIQALVCSLGYRAPAFSSAQEFLRSPEIEETECLILDVQMPGMSGIDLQRTLAAQQWKLPIIFVTAFADEHLREEALGGGAAYFLFKPIERQLVANCLKTVLGGRAL